jgi:hypothetical protein
MKVKVSQTSHDIDASFVAKREKIEMRNKTLRAGALVKQVRFLISRRAA